MIYLNNTGDNEVIVTLYERCVNTVNPYFTWVLTNSDSRVETTFYQDDHSTVPYYYNSFTLSIATYSGLTAGILNIPIGQYIYDIYEMSTQYDLNISNSIGLVETGILNVIGTQSNNVTTFTASEADTIVVFRG